MNNATKNTNAVFTDLTWFAPRGTWKKKIGGKVHYFRGDGSKTPSEGNYEVALQQLQALLASAPTPTAPTTAVVPSLSEVISDYLSERETECKAGQLSFARLDRLSLYLAKFSAYAGGSLPITVVSETLLGDFRRTLLADVADKTLSAYTAAYTLDAILAVLQWAWEHRLVSDLPRNKRSLGVTLPTPKPKAYNKAEIAAILSACETDYQRLLVLLPLNTGMLQADISALAPNDYDGQFLYKARQKTGIMGCWRLWPETVALVEKLRKTTGDRLFLGEKGNPLVHGSSDAVKLVWERIAKKAKVAGLYKTLRSTAASIIEEQGYVDIVSIFLAHKRHSVASKFYISEEAKRTALRNNSRLAEATEAVRKIVFPVDGLLPSV